MCDIYDFEAIQEDEDLDADDQAFMVGYLGE